MPRGRPSRYEQRHALLELQRLQFAETDIDELEAGQQELVGKYEKLRNEVREGLADMRALQDKRQVRTLFWVLGIAGVVIAFLIGQLVILHVATQNVPAVTKP